MIKWVTLQMAKDAAAKGLQAAIDMSAKKWFNYGFCTQEQFEKKDRGVHVDYQMCALCAMPRVGCCNCLLTKKLNYSCRDDESLYQQAINLLNKYRENSTKTNFLKFQQKSRKLWRVIKGLL